MTEPSQPHRYVELLVEQWRLIKILSRLVEHLPPESQARVAAQARYAGSKLDAFVRRENVQLEVFDGRSFEASLPVAAVNAVDFTDTYSLLVVDTIEPTVLHDGQVVHIGRVILGELVSNASGH